MVRVSLKIRCFPTKRNDIGAPPTAERQVAWLDISTDYASAICGIICAYDVVAVASEISSTVGRMLGLRFG